MDDPRVLRIITVGLILASIVVIYLLFTGGFAVKSKVNKQANNVTQNNTLSATPSPTPTSSPKVIGSYKVTTTATSTPSAFNRVTSRSQVTGQKGAQTLPDTGFPILLALVFSASAIVAGITLRKLAK